MPGLLAGDSGQALAKIETNMVTVGARYDITNFCKLIYDYGEQDGYTKAGNAVSLTDSTNIITVPTSYDFSSVYSANRWGTTDYTLTIYAITNGTEAKLSGAKGSITNSMSLTLSLPTNIDGEGKAMAKIQGYDASGTLIDIKSADAIALYNAGKKAGWDLAASSDHLFRSGPNQWDRNTYVYGPKVGDYYNHGLKWTYRPDNLTADIGDCTLPTGTYYTLTSGPISAAYYYGDGKGTDAIVSYNGSSWKAYRSSSNWYTVSGVTVYTGHTQASPYLTGDHSSFG